MKIYARITTESKELTQEEFEKIVEYLSEGAKGDSSLYHDVAEILKRVFPKINERTEDSYIPGSWIEDAAYDNGIELNKYCNDICLDLI